MATAHKDGTIDKEALRRRYAAERDKRLRTDGAAQYKRLESEFTDLAADPGRPDHLHELIETVGRSAKALITDGGNRFFSSPRNELTTSLASAVRVVVKICAGIEV